MEAYQVNRSFGILAENELLKLCIRLETLGNSSLRLQHKHEEKFKMAVDALEPLSSDIHRAKEENARLLADIEKVKQTFNKLQHDMDKLKSRFVSCQKELRSLGKEKQFFDDTRELLETTEKRGRKMSKINQELRLTLLKQNINPDLSAQSVFKLDGMKSPLRKKKGINAVPLRRKLLPQKISWE